VIDGAKSVEEPRELPGFNRQGHKLKTRVNDSSEMRLAFGFGFFWFDVL
jgi:hypothetical protein